MKPSAILFASAMALLCSCSKPTPPPPAPYTNKELAHLYWTETLKGAISNPDSVKIFSEDIDSVRDIWQGDSVMFYIIDADYSFQNSYGGWTRDYKRFITSPGRFLAVGVKDLSILQAWEEYACEHFSDIHDIRPLRKVISDDSLRTARWNAYQDSIKSR